MYYRRRIGDASSATRVVGESSRWPRQAALRRRSGCRRSSHRYPAGNVISTVLTDSDDGTDLARRLGEQLDPLLNKHFQLDTPGYFDKTSACRGGLLIFAAKDQVICFLTPSRTVETQTSLRHCEDERGLCRAQSRPYTRRTLTARLIPSTSIRPSLVTVACGQ
jgi:hypothetical protein